MLLISAKQIAALENDQIDKFKSELFIRFREDYPRQTHYHSDEKLRTIIDTATKAGLDSGLKTVGGLSQFVGIAVMVYEDFYKQQEIIDYFEYSGFTGDDKMAILAKSLTKKLRSIK